MKNADEYQWSVALPPDGLCVEQKSYDRALAIVREMHKMGVRVALLRETMGGGPYEEIPVTFVGYEDD